MSDPKIEIDITSDESFKKGIREIHAQLAHLSNLSSEIERVSDMLRRLEKEAVYEYCSKYPKSTRMINYVPKHLAKWGRV